MYNVFEVSIGLEYDLMATAVVRSLKHAQPERKIIVTTHNPEVWLHNPDVWRVYHLGSTPYFYDDFIKDKPDTVVYRQSPIDTNAFIHKEKHLIEIWCDLVGVPCIQKVPVLVFTHRENQAVSRMINRGKPIFLMQAFVGIPNTPYPNSWARDIHPNVAQQIVNEMTNKGFHCVQIRRDDQPNMKGAETITLNTRMILCAIQFSSARLFVDSFAQHAAAGLNIPSSVQWVANDPKIFGYPLHHNISPKDIAPVMRFISTYSEPFGFFIPPEAVPPINESLFSITEITRSLLNQIKK